MFLNNLGTQPLTLTHYAYALGDSGDDVPTWIPIHPSSSDPAIWILNEGFTAHLPPLGTVIQGGASVAVELGFKPENVGDFSLVLGVRADVSGEVWKVIVLAG